MSGKTNAKSKLVMGGNRNKEIGSTQLTETERVQVTVLIEKQNELQAQVELVGRAVSSLILTIVSSRGLDPKKYGVNVGQGKVLPLEE